jgi:hypothetical protein
MLDPVLAALIREKLPGKRFGVYFACGEGAVIPDGTEESSGHVVDEDGRHYVYWTDWLNDRLALGEWREVKHEPRWERSSEYQDARREAGLEG